MVAKRREDFLFTYFQFRFRQWSCEIMPTFREAREALLYAFSDDLITDEEFVLLYDINKSKNRDFEYWNYEKFSLFDVSDDDCIAEFRFEKHDITRLKNALQLPNTIRCRLYNDLKVDSTEALCILLKRLAYPCRYSDMIHRFSRPVPQLSMIFNELLNIIDNRWMFLLQNLNDTF